MFNISVHHYNIWEKIRASIVCIFYFCVTRILKKSCHINCKLDYSNWAVLLLQTVSFRSNRKWPKCFPKPPALHTDKTLSLKRTHTHTHSLLRYLFLLCCHSETHTHTHTLEEVDNRDSTAEFLTLLWNFFFLGGLLWHQGTVTLTESERQGSVQFCCLLKLDGSSCAWSVYGKSLYLSIYRHAVCFVLFLAISHIINEF